MAPRAATPAKAGSGSTRGSVQSSSAIPQLRSAATRVTRSSVAAPRGQAPAADDDASIPTVPKKRLVRPASVTKENQAPSATAKRTVKKAPTPPAAVSQTLRSRPASVAARKTTEAASANRATSAVSLEMKKTTRLVAARSVITVKTPLKRQASVPRVTKNAVRATKESCIPRASKILEESISELTIGLDSISIRDVSDIDGLSLPQLKNHLFGTQTIDPVALYITFGATTSATRTLKKKAAVHIAQHPFEDLKRLHGRCCEHLEGIRKAGGPSKTWSQRRQADASQTLLMVGSCVIAMDLRDPQQSAADILDLWFNCVYRAVEDGLVLVHPTSVTQPCSLLYTIL